MPSWSQAGLNQRLSAPMTEHEMFKQYLIVLEEVQELDR